MPNESLICCFRTLLAAFLVPVLLRLCQQCWPHVGRRLEAEQVDERGCDVREPSVLRSRLREMDPFRQAFAANSNRDLLTEARVSVLWLHRIGNNKTLCSKRCCHGGMDLNSKGC